MGGDRWLPAKISVYASGVTLKYAIGGRGTDDHIICRDPASTALESLPYDRSEPKRTPRVYLDHNRDRSDADDGTGPIAATGIRRHDGSSGIGRHHSIWPHLLVTRIYGNSKPIICFRFYGR
jgi:hypothetical protein